MLTLSETSSKTLGLTFAWGCRGVESSRVLATCRVHLAWLGGGVSFTSKQPKFKILVAADPIANEGSRQAAIDQLSGLGRTCNKCLDQFTSLWLDRLGRDLPRAVDCLDLHVASMLICSVRVEKKHLLGQELRKRRSRGAAPSAMEVAKRTYQKSVVLESSSKSEVILREALGNTSRWAFTRLAYAQAVEKR